MSNIEYLWLPADSWRFFQFTWDVLVLYSLVQHKLTPISCLTPQNFLIWFMWHTKPFNKGEYTLICAVSDISQVQLIERCYKFPSLSIGWAKGTSKGDIPCENCNGDYQYHPNKDRISVLVSKARLDWLKAWALDHLCMPQKWLLNGVHFGWILKAYIFSIVYCICGYQLLFCKI